MSGPIVRKYGFPNFEKIFGERGLEHGVDDDASEPAEGSDAGANADAAAGGKKPAKAKKEPKRTK